MTVRVQNELQSQDFQLYFLEIIQKYWRLFAYESVKTPGKCKVAGSDPSKHYWSGSKRQQLARAQCN